MTLSPARRRVIDRWVAAGLFVIVVLAGTVVYWTSDLRATTLSTGPSQATPAAPNAAPATLTERWTLPTDPALGAVASPYGVVAVADAHTVRGHDAVTGAPRWSYERSNVALCAIGSGDADAPGIDRRGRVRGILTVFELGGVCSQLVLLDPVTGDRHYVRTSANQPGGSLAFGGPYAGWLGPSLVELWRDDLVRTIQYGEQPQPPKADTIRAGCEFTDLALADKQFATVEHCADRGPNALVVLNWATPADAPDKPDGQDVFKHEPRAEIDTGSTAARIVGITADRVAVLVAAPTPAVVVYDAAGTETSRTPVDLPADAVRAADARRAPDRTAATPAIQDGDTRYSIVGSHLLAVSSRTIDVVVPPTPTTGTASDTAGASTSAVAPPDGSSGALSLSGLVSGLELPIPPDEVTEATGVDGGETTTEQRRDLVLEWQRAGALGLPAVVGEQLLLPVDGGLAVLPKADGAAPAAVTVPVDRGGYAGRVDAAAVGTMIIETRGDLVVGLS